MSIFSSILNMDYEGLMTLKIDYYFSYSFHDSFLEYSRYLDFPSDLISELDPLSSLNGSIFLARETMRRFIVPLMLVTCASNRSSLSSVGSRRFL
jgi:hypothetical protein